MKTKIPPYVLEVIKLLTDAGFEAFAVGGCIRDIYLSKMPDDWDVTTNANPEQMMQVFKDFRVILTGIKHGTLTVLTDGHSVEITTYRIDGSYEDNRHPQNVTFTTRLKDDLARRDFTMNTLAYNPETGLVDEFGGAADIDAKLIRCVGDPDRRFTEDALRIMRALRFSSVLGFEIEPETSASILRNRELLKNISAERISAELLKLLCGKDVTRILIEYREVIAVIIPELRPCFDFDQKNKHHIYNVYDHIAYSVGFAEPEPDIRLALLLHDIAKPKCFFTDESGVGHFYGHGKAGAEMSYPILKRLRLSGETVKTVHDLVMYHDIPVEPNKKIVLRRLNKYGETLLRKILKVKKGDGSAHNPANMQPVYEIDEVVSLIDKLTGDGECFDIRSLKINGDDLVALNFPKGPEIGRALNQLLLEVIDGKIENEPGALKARAKELKHLNRM